MSRPLITLLLLLLPLLPATAQNTDALREAYLRMQEAYTERATLLEAEYTEAEQREINAFIIDLVRIEQHYRDEGELAGVLQTRQIQERMLETQTLPDPEAEPLPEKILERITQSRENLQLARDTVQEKLNTLNQAFADRLEPIMRDLTRAGDFTTAREILGIRNEIFASLNVRPSIRPTHRSEAELRAPNDPNIFPVSVEPPGFSERPGLIPRSTQLPFQPQTEGDLTQSPQGIILRGGRFTIPAHATEALIHQIGRTQTITIELGFRISQPFQHAPILCFGRSPEESNFALLQDGNNLTLLFTTSSQTGGIQRNRIDLGPANVGAMQHLVISYRPGDLAIFRNGGGTRRNRDDANGDLRAWEMKPLHLGQAEIPPSPDFPPPAWNGTIVNLQINALPVTPRGITSSFERFTRFISGR